MPFGTFHPPGALPSLAHSAVASKRSWRHWVGQEADMKRTRFIIALALLLAAQTAAKADPRTTRFCGPDHVNEVASDVRPSPGGHYVASLKSMDDRAMSTAFAVTIHLTSQWELIRLPHVKP